MSAANRTSVMFAVIVLGLGLSSELLAEPPGLGPAGDLQRIEFEAAGPTTLVGRNARRQLLVTGVYASGQRHDLTHGVAYSVSAPAVLGVDAEGLVTPLTDGVSRVTATEPGAHGDD